MFVTSIVVAEPVTVKSPKILTSPAPSGFNVILPADDVVIETADPVMFFPLTSKSPPSCGVVSSTTSVVVSISEAITQLDPLYFKILFVATPEVSTSDN